jgi:hypothetical protein
MRTLVRILAGINLLFAAFHVLLALQVWGLTDLHSQIHALLIMLAVGGTLFILFLGIALFWTREVLSTSIGKVLLLLGAATYLIRGVEELTISPTITMPILVVCAITGALHLVPLFGKRA